MFVLNSHALICLISKSEKGKSPQGIPLVPAKLCGIVTRVPDLPAQLPVYKQVPEPDSDPDLFEEYSQLELPNFSIMPPECEQPFSPKYPWRMLNPIPVLPELTREAINITIDYLENDVNRMQTVNMFGINAMVGECMAEKRATKPNTLKRKNVDCHLNALHNEGNITNKRMKRVQKLISELKRELCPDEMKTCVACACDTELKPFRPLIAPYLVPSCNKNEFHVFHFGCFIVRLVATDPLGGPVPLDLFQRMMDDETEGLDELFKDIKDNWKTNKHFVCPAYDICDGKFRFDAHKNEIHLLPIRNLFEDVYHCLNHPDNEIKHHNHDDLVNIMSEVEDI